MDAIINNLNFLSISGISDERKFKLFDIMKHDFYKIIDNYIYFYHNEDIFISFDFHRDEHLLNDRKLLSELIHFLNKHGYRFMIEVIKERYPDISQLGKIIHIEAMVDYYISIIESYQII